MIAAPRMDCLFSSSYSSSGLESSYHEKKGAEQSTPIEAGKKPSKNLDTLLRRVRASHCEQAVFSMRKTKLHCSNSSEET